MFILPSSSVFPRRCRHGASQSGQRTAQRSTGRRSWLWRRRKGPTANECGRPRKPRDSRTGLTLRAPAGTGPADTPILPQRAPTSAQNCEMITRVALSHQVCDSVPQRPPDSPPQARTRPHPRPPLPGKDDPVLGLDGPHSSPTPTSREPGAVSVRPEGGRQHHSLRSTFHTCSGTRLYAHPRSWGSRLGRMILDQEHPSPFGRGARPASHGCHWAPPPPIYTLLPADRPASPHLVERASSAG